MAWIALNARKNAALNPKAIYREPLSLDDYLSARMISTPFCLFDCDVPCDGGPAAGGGDRHRPVGAPHLGPVRRLDADGEPRRGEAHVEPHRPEALRRRPR